MMPRKLLAFIVLFIALFMAVPLTGAVYAKGAHAADSYSSGTVLNEKAVPYSNKYWSARPNDNVISLVRKPGLGAGQFVLRITNPYVMNGCVTLSNYGYSAEYRDLYLDVTIGDLTIDMRNQPRYAHFQCTQKTQMPAADIILNRQDLEKNKTEKIRMHNGNDTNYYDITLSDNMVRLLPDKTGSRIKRFKPHNIPGRKTSLIYWFYPAGTIIMWVPAAEKNQDITEKLRFFAKSKNLVPLDTIYPNFESPLTDTQYYYFVDREGRFTGNEAALRKGEPVGNIFVDKIIYGLEADKIEQRKIAVYARTPGLYE